MKDLKDAVSKYPPGQGGIDGGGWEVKDEQDRYLYVQFESLKNGFIDDVEFAVADDGTVGMRSSSRLGFLDFGVNARRLNWFAKELGAREGWTTFTITSETHPTYFSNY